MGRSARDQYFSGAGLLCRPCCAGCAYLSHLVDLALRCSACCGGCCLAFLFSPSIGVVSYALNAMGFEWNALLNSRDAMALIVMAAVWKQLSYNFLFFLAGLQSIPKSLIEAAAIDGAGAWRRFWTIQFPLLSPTSFSCW